MIAMLVYCSVFSTIIIILFILKIGSTSSSSLHLHVIAAVYNIWLINEINEDINTHILWLAVGKARQSLCFSLGLRGILRIITNPCFCWPLNPQPISLLLGTTLLHSFSCHLSSNNSDGWGPLEVGSLVWGLRLCLRRDSDSYALP